jgi:hypothetical protein
MKHMLKEEEDQVTSVGKTITIVQFQMYTNVDKHRIRLCILVLVAVVLLFHVLVWRRKSTQSLPDIVKQRKTSSDHWVIIHSLVVLQEYLTSPRANLSIIFNGDESTEDILKTSNVIILNRKSRTKNRFYSTHPHMLAYLLAIEHGARFIYEYHPNMSLANDVRYIAFRRQRSPFINIHPTFTADFTSSSPGLPEEELVAISQDGWSSIRAIDRNQDSIQPLIQQQLRVNVKDSSAFVNHPPVAIEPFTFVPFSNENILFTYDAFWGLLLSHSKSSIWRSWWVQRLLWDIHGHVVFDSSAYETNTATLVHNIDKNKTIVDDVKIGQLVRFLDQWRSTKATLAERIEQLTIELIERNSCDANELQNVRFWLNDLRRINYVFPIIKTSSTKQVRVALSINLCFHIFQLKFRQKIE